MRIMKLHSLEYMKKHFYQDGDGDFWENKSVFLRTTEVGGWHNAPYVESFLLNGDLLIKPESDMSQYNRMNQDNLSWAIESFYTPITHPEYFL